MFNIHLEIEKWKFNDHYQIYVSNFGRFKDKNKNFIETRINHKGYVTLSFKNTHKLVHRIVIETFKPELCLDKMTIDHLDSNKRNNRLDNLEAVPFKENQRRAQEKYLNCHLSEENLNDISYSEDLEKMNLIVRDIFDSAAARIKFNQNLTNISKEDIRKKIINSFANGNTKYGINWGLNN